MGTQIPSRLPTLKGDDSQEPNAPVYILEVPAGSTWTYDPLVTALPHVLTPPTFAGVWRQGDGGEETLNQLSLSPNG